MDTTLMRLARRLGLAAVLSALTVSLAPAPAAAQGCNTSVRFLNQTNRTVQQLYYNPSSNSNWGPDRLGANVMRPGRSTACGCRMPRRMISASSWTMATRPRRGG